MISVYHCPKCGAELDSSGVLSIDGAEMPVFQCDTCVIRRSVFGPGSEQIELAFTFAVNAAGQPISPGDESLL